MATGIIPWDQGNVVGDGAIDQLDVLALRHHFGFTAAAAQPAPEPATIAPLVVGVIIWSMWRFRHR